jgi:hypothetical protein
MRQPWNRRFTTLTSRFSSQTLYVPMAEPKENPLMEKIVSLCKRRGFIYQSSEIYGGINGFWDYGPLGAELKRNVKMLSDSTRRSSCRRKSGKRPATSRRSAIR